MGDNFTFLLPVVLALFGSAFLIVARFGNRASLFWGLGYLSVSVAFLSPVLLSGFAVEVVAMTAEAFFLAGFFFYGHAVATHFATPAWMWPRALLALAAYAAIAYAVIVSGSLRAELLLSDLTCAALLIVPLWFAGPGLQRPIDRALFLVVALVVAETLVRNAIYMLSGEVAALEQFGTSGYVYLMQVIATIGALLMALTALAAVTVRLIEHHRDVAEQDPLTALLNRRGFERAVPVSSQRAGGAVIVADIDHFKSINDKFGHAIGDQVIRQVANVLKSTARSGVAVARFGGEEFIVFLPGCALSEACLLAEEMRVRLAGRDWSDIGLRQQVTVSFGVDVAAAGDHSIHDAISRADRSLYKAKNSGRNRVVCGDAQPDDFARPRLVVVNDGTGRH